TCAVIVAGRAWLPRVPPTVPADTAGAAANRGALSGRCRSVRLYGLFVILRSFFVPQSHRLFLDRPHLRTIISRYRPDAGQPLYEVGPALRENEVEECMKRCSPP